MHFLNTTDKIKKLETLPWQALRDIAVKKGIDEKEVDSKENIQIEPKRLPFECVVNFNEQAVTLYSKEDLQAAIGDMTTNKFSTRLSLETSKNLVFAYLWFITEEAIRCSVTKKIPRDSVLIVLKVGVGKVVVAPCELCTSQDFTNIVKPKCNSLFLGYMLSNIMQIKTNGVQGTSIKGVPAKEIKQYRIPIPCLEEQQKIADFLYAYDEAITCAKQELDKWKELKKGLLQQMFVW